MWVKEQINGFEDEEKTELIKTVNQELIRNVNYHLLSREKVEKL